MFMESSTLRVSCKVNVALQETRGVHDSMNRPNIEFISYMILKSAKPTVVTISPPSARAKREVFSQLFLLTSYLTFDTLFLAYERRHVISNKMVL